MAGNDRISREWDAAGESWADFVREGKDYYREEMNNPAFFNVLGDIAGKWVLDLACGEGYNTRILARKGAEAVGVDFSENLIELAKQEENEERHGITYLVLDAADMKELSNSQFDIVTCFMALMDIEHYEEALSEVSRVLNKNGIFVFSIPHPCFEWGKTEDAEEIAEWKYAEGKEGAQERIVLGLEVKRYFGISMIPVQWTNRVLRPFTTTSFHRTLTDYFQALYRNGFLVARLVEPKPTAKGVREYPSLRKHMKIPHSVIIEATKISTTIQDCLNRSKG